MTKPGLKEQVKSGDLEASKALEMLLEKCKTENDKTRAYSSKTGEWLRKVMSGKITISKPDKRD